MRRSCEVSSQKRQFFVLLDKRLLRSSLSSRSSASRRSIGKFAKLANLIEAIIDQAEKGRVLSSFQKVTEMGW